MIGKQPTRRSSTLKTALSRPAVDGKGRRDNASATAFCLDRWRKFNAVMTAARIIAYRCRRISANDGIAVFGPKMIRSSVL